MVLELITCRPGGPPPMIPLPQPPERLGDRPGLAARASLLILTTLMLRAWQSFTDEPYFIVQKFRNHNYFTEGGSYLSINHPPHTEMEFYFSLLQIN